MFDFISYFKVEDFNPMFSDVHCRLSFTLLFNTPNKCNSIHNDNNKLKNQDKWTSENIGLKSSTLK
jgi:hypothetical protein